MQKKKERLASTEDKPTLPELIKFKTQSGSINIMEMISLHYHQLGSLLLEDGDGSVTDPIINQYHHDATPINQEILKRWLGGTGLKPVQWPTLVSILKDINLSTVAERLRRIYNELCVQLGVLSSFSILHFFVHTLPEIKPAFS